MERRVGIGIAFALQTGATFGTAGVFAKPLLHAGWSPGAVVSFRVLVGAVLMVVPTLLVMRGRWRLLRPNAGLVTAYGLVAVAGCQFAYFMAVQRISVGVALLLEYLGLLLVVGWMWAVHGRRPGRLTLLGTAVAIGGLLLVLDVFAGFTLDPVGVLWGLVAAFGLAMFFVVSAQQHEETLPPIALAGFGLMVGAVVLWGSVGLGLLSFVRGAGAADIALFGHRPWWFYVLWLGVVATAVSYSTGVLAARHCGPTLATFLGLTEVLFAALFAWLLLGEAPGLVQGLGGLLVIGGVVLVRVGELGSEPAGERDHPLVATPGPEVVAESAVEVGTDFPTRAAVS